jgi:phosphomethylpyrimidine synthase
MKITQEVRDYAAKQDMTASEVLASGMAEKSREFVNKGSEIYL